MNQMGKHQQPVWLNRFSLLRKQQGAILLKRLLLWCRPCREIRTQSSKSQEWKSLVVERDQLSTSVKFCHAKKQWSLPTDLAWMRCVASLCKGFNCQGADHWFGFVYIMDDTERQWAVCSGSLGLYRRVHWSKRKMPIKSLLIPSFCGRERRRRRRISAGESNPIQVIFN